MSVRRHVALTFSTLLLVIGLTGCSDESDVCSGVDAVEASVDNLKDVQVAENGLNALSSGIDQVEQDLADLGSEAKAEFGDEIGAVTTAVDNLKGAVSTATSDPSSASLVDVTTSLAAVGTSIDDLVQTVRATC